jgi:hypothetical protein
MKGGNEQMSDESHNPKEYQGPMSFMSKILGRHSASAQDSDDAPVRLAAKACDLAWDPHLSLNVLNRLSSRLSHDAQGAELVYTLAEHLRCLAFVQNAPRLVRPVRLQEWADAILGMHQLFHPQAQRAACETLDRGVDEVEVVPVTANIVAALRLCGDVRRLSLAFSAAQAPGGTGALAGHACQVRLAITPAVVEKKLPGLALVMTPVDTCWVLNPHDAAYEAVLPLRGRLSE